MAYQFKGPLRHFVYTSSFSHPVASIWRSVVAACIVAIPLALTAQPAQTGETYHPGKSRSAQQSATLSELSNDITTLIGDKNFADASWGISVVSCDDSKVLFDFESVKNRQVASNIKLLTTASALMRLGANYRFSTDVFVNGALLPNGELAGNLVIRTSGDPSISSSYGIDPRTVIGNWVRALDSLGIRSLQNVLVDASVFDAAPYAPGWAWDDEPYGFNAQISGAAVYDNAIEVRVTPAKIPGNPVLIDIYPSTAYVTLKVTASTSRQDSLSTIDIRRERGSSVITVSGNIAAGSEPYTELISIENPPLYLGALVQEELERAGITIYGSIYNAAEYPESRDYAAMRFVASHRSPELREIVQTVNKQSMNLGAEMLVKKLGREFGGAGSTNAGIEVIYRFLTKSGVDQEHINIVDGSGLSRLNMISAGDITTLLLWLSKSVIAKDFMASLSVAGKDGTLRNRLQGTRAEGNIYGKTGFLSGIRSVCGYARTNDGSLLAFSIITDNYSVPTSVVNTVHDLILMRLASYSKKG